VAVCVVVQWHRNYVEYALIIASLAVVVLLGAYYFGGQIREWFMSLVEHITTLSS